MRMVNRQLLLRTMLLCMCTTSIAHAAPTTLPAVEAMLGERLTLLENQIASWTLQRAGQAVGQRLWTDVRIDLLILQRWFVQTSQGAGRETDAQVAGWLRATELADASADVEGWIDSKPSINPEQAKALASLHALTYALPGGQTIADTDHVASDVARFLSAAMLVQATPQIRPAPSVGQAVDASDSPAPSDADVASLRSLTVSDVLQKQLLDLDARIRSTNPAIKDPSELALLTETLQKAIRIVRGLSSANVMNDNDRKDLEQKLAEGLALFVDVRTRPAGRARLLPLEGKGEVLARISALPMTPEMFEELEPAFQVAMADEQNGPVILRTIEQFLEISRADSNRPADAKLPEPYNATLQKITDAFKTRQGDFMGDAAALGGMAGSDLKQWQAHLEALGRLAKLRPVVAQLATDAPALIALKTRPFGAIEKRIAQMLSQILSEKRAEREAAIANLNAVATLASVATAVGQAGEPVPASIAARYASNRLDAFESRRKTLVGELTNAFAAGLPLDAGKLAVLSQSIQMRSALTDAAAQEAAVTNAQALSQWIDFDVKPADLSRRMEPYRENLNKAFEGVVRGDAEAVERWSRSRGRYVALGGFVRTLAERYGATASAYPEGMPGVLGRLLTPVDRQPFAGVRYASFALAVWARCEDKSDFSNADLAADVLAERINRGQLDR